MLLYEGIVTLCNLCILILAKKDNDGDFEEDSRNILGDIIVGCNFAGLLVLILFTILKFI